MHRRSVLRLLTLAAVSLAPIACDAPSTAFAPAARVAPAVEAKVCADATDPICSVFSSTVYAYSPSLGALPPGVSNWRVVITQFGGQLDFFGVVEHGGAPIVDVRQMYLRFFLDNGDGALGAGDLQVVIVNSPAGATLHCGLVTSLPVGSALPTSSPALCETGGVSWNEPGRFLFDDFRTADLSAPLWESQGFARLRANERRALFLVEVGNVGVTPTGEPELEAPTAPPTRVDSLSVVPNPGDDNGGGEGEGGGDADTTPPTITFTGNAGHYGVLDQVRIGCSVEDEASAIASSVCPSVDAAAYTLPLGLNTLSATATDAAGNAASAATSFTVTVSAADLCALAQQLVPRQATPLCAQLRNGTRAFTNHLRAQRGKQVPAEIADLLTRLAAGL